MEIYLNPLGVAVCTSGSDPEGLRSARREGAIPLSITVSTAGSNPAGVGSTPNRGARQYGRKSYMSFYLS